MGSPFLHGSNPMDNFPLNNPLENVGATMGIMTLDQQVQKLKSQVENLDRGMYGDKVNGVPGVADDIRTIKHQLNEIGAALEQQKRQFYYRGALEVIVVAVILYLAVAM